MMRLLLLVSLACGEPTPETLDAGITTLDLEHPLKLKCLEYAQEYYVTPTGLVSYEFCLRYICVGDCPTPH